MATSPDPLGKRALFWAPGERTDLKPLDSKAPVPGKRALFSTPAPQPGAITLDCSSCRYPLAGVVRSSSCASTCRSGSGCRAADSRGS